jgi:L-lactate dehydrogenase complex protein LldG
VKSKTIASFQWFWFSLIIHRSSLIAEPIVSSRAEILARIRSRQGKAVTPRAAEREVVAAEIAARAAGPRPGMPADLEARFVERARSLATTIEDIADLPALPRAVADYLQRQSLPPAAVCWPAFAGLDWAGAGLAVEARPARDGDLVGITGVFCAIAETGTLMLCSGEATPALNSLLPETHIAVVPRSRIVSGMEEGWALLRAELGAMPRAVNFVSGPSRTADIEQTVTLGAHGPYRVHLLLL